jgi:hypothetical protein
MDYVILFILANFQKSCLNQCCCDTNFVVVFIYIYIANLIDKLETRRFGGTFSLGVLAVERNRTLQSLLENTYKNFGCDDALSLILN